MNFDDCIIDISLLVFSFVKYRSAPVSPTHGMVMPPPFKQSNKSESDDQKPLRSQHQQQKSLAPQLVHRTTSDSVLGVVKSESIEITAASDPILLLEKQNSSPTTKLPPALQPMKVTSASYKSVTPIISGQPGAQSVFFTSAKLVTQTMAEQGVKAGSPTTANGTFLMPQIAKTTKERQIRPTVVSAPPTLLFRTTSQPLTQVRNLQPSHLQNIKTVTPIITNGQVFSSPNNIILQPVGQDTATVKLECNSTSTASSTVVFSSQLLIPAMTSAMQTVSVIKQQAASSDAAAKDMKPFTSITDILSSKDSKADLLASKIFFSKYIYLLYSQFGCYHLTVF